MEASSPVDESATPATDTEKIETVLESVNAPKEKTLSELNVTDEIKLNTKATTEVISTTEQTLQELESVKSGSSEIQGFKPKAEESEQSLEQPGNSVLEGTDSNDNDSNDNDSSSGLDESDEPDLNESPHPVVVEDQAVKKEKSSLKVDSRLVPIKKGEFYEHDNRSETVEATDQGSKLAMDKVEKEVGGVSSKKGHKWSHDLFEGQEKVAVKKKKPAKVKVEKTEKAVVKTDEKGERPKKEVKKGLPLAEYLGDGGGGGEDKKGKQQVSGQLKPGNKSKNEGNNSGQNRPNKGQPQQQQQLQQGLQKRLDFSTRKPITSENFTETPVSSSVNTKQQAKHHNTSDRPNKPDLTSQIRNLKITTHVDSSKRIVTEGPIDAPSLLAAQHTPSLKKTLFNDDSLILTHQAGHKHPGPKPGMTKSNTTHFLSNVKTNPKDQANSNNYDEYYFDDYDVLDTSDYSNHSHRLQRGTINRDSNYPLINRRSKDDHYVQAYVDSSNLHIYNTTNHIPIHHQQLQQHLRRRKLNNDQSTANYNEYLDYSGYSPTEDSLYSQGASAMYPIHQQSFMPKSHSFHNRTSFNNIQIQPQFEFDKSLYRVNNFVNPVKSQAKNVGFVFQASQGNPTGQSGQVSQQVSSPPVKSSSKIRFDVNQQPFTPKAAISGASGTQQ